MALNITATWQSKRIGFVRSAIKAFSSDAGPVIPKKSSEAVPSIPKNTLENLISAQNQKENGAIYDKKPMRIALEAGKRYSWCLCGRSHNQPFCDGTHRNEQLRITQKPIRFSVDETKEYWLCNCKQTRSRPFCDGTHKTPRVQDGVSIIRQ